MDILSSYNFNRGGICSLFDIKMEKENLFKKRKTITLFAIVALIGGFLFLSPNITGGFILEEANSFSLLSLIGLLLISCAIVLATYSLKKK